METQSERIQLLAPRLYDAAIKGDVNTLHNLVREDALILDRCIIEKSDRYMLSPLHVAANLGHVDFATEVLRLKPELAEQLDQSSRSSALHLASAKGHLDVVKMLLEVRPNMCLARDQDGRNPVHVAAISSQLHVLDELVRTKPYAARARTNAGETVLHLCVMYDLQLETLKYLVNAMDDSELLNAKDNDDNTVLHLTVFTKQPEAVKFLVTNEKIQQNAINKNGLTAMDWLIQNRKSLQDEEILRTLKRAKAFEAKHVLRQKGKDKKWLNKQRNALMVVASLIATMAFQIGINPPGGAWQDTDPEPVNGHRVGTSIMATTDRGPFENLILANTVSLISSLSVVLLLISGLPCKRFFVVLLMITMWVAITATSLTYYFSVNYLSDRYNSQQHISDLWVETGLLVWMVLVGILLLGHIIRSLFKPAKNMVQLLMNPNVA